ncbi:MAG: metallophosphoesterase family protein [Anaerolineales bacterium]|jgi:predicted phosphodiesterase
MQKSTSNSIPVTSEFRSAILADIHGNSIALDAVLEDVERKGGVDQYWLLGDYAAIGFDPVGVLQRLERLSDVKLIRGNTDRYLVEQQQPGPSLVEVRKNLKLMEVYAHIASSFAWTTGAVGSAGWLPWLSELPLEIRVKLPDGTRVLAVHAAPGNDDGGGIHPGLTDEDIEELIRGVDAELILFGHTHTTFDRTIRGVRLVNPGSVSNPFPPDLRARYTLLDANGEGYTLSFHQVEYDRQAVIRASREVNHPAAEYIASFMCGERRPSWAKE